MSRTHFTFDMPSRCEQLSDAPQTPLNHVRSALRTSEKCTLGIESVALLANVVAVGITVALGMQWARAHPPCGTRAAFYS